VKGPWSAQIPYDEDGKFRQIYIGDGFAALDTSRQIFIRTRLDDDEGLELDRIDGYGILVWPREVKRGSV
jgi:hypothetical protein